MLTSTGQCPNCHTINAYTATNCLECNGPLPWADAILKERQQAQAAQQLAQATQQQAQQAVQQTAQQAQAALAQQAVSHAQARQGKLQFPPPQTSPDAVNIYETYIGSIIGNWSSAFIGIKQDGALWTGLVCAFIYCVGVVIGTNLMLRKVGALFASGLAAFGRVPASLQSEATGLTGGQIIKLMAVAAIPFLCIAISSALLRKLFSDDEEGSFSNDIFIAGISLLPTGLYVLASGWLGLGNIEVSAVCAVFALCYTIILLHNGCTIVSRIKDTAAALSVPVILLLSAWLTKIVLTQLVHT